MVMSGIEANSPRLTASGTPVPRLRGIVVEAIRARVRREPREAARAGHRGAAAIKVHGQPLFVLRGPRNRRGRVALRGGLLVDVVVRSATVLAAEGNLLRRVTEGRGAAHVDAGRGRGVHHARKLGANGSGDTA